MHWHTSLDIMPIFTRSQTSTRQQGPYQTMYISSDKNLEAFFDPTQDIHVQQQGFHPKIMDTSQTPFVQTQGFDPNMAYTSNDITSFDQTQTMPSTTYDESLESYMLLIKRL